MSPKEIGSDLKLSLLNILNKKLSGNITVLHLLIALFILTLTFLFTKFVSLQMKKRFKGKIEDFKLDLMTKSINGFIYAVSIIWVLNIIGVNITSLFVAGGIIGVILGFATQRVGSNLVSGLFLMIERPFADSSVNIKILFWVPSSKWFDIKSKLLWKIKMALEENGIQIPFPQRELWFNNELSFKSLNSNQ